MGYTELGYYDDARPRKDTRMRNVHRKAYQEFLRRLRRARKESGYTQTEVAKKLKRPQSYVSKAECGERRLDFVEVREFAALYGKEINYFE